MDTTELKTELTAICRDKILESIRNIEAAMTDAQQQANDYGPPKDRYDSFRSQLMRRRDMMAQQLSKELQELQALERIDTGKIMTAAGFGAIIQTTGQNYFIAVGLGKIENKGIDYYAISPGVPISTVLQGKKKGDRVEFRDTRFTISEIY